MTNQNSAALLTAGSKTISRDDTVLAKFFFVWNNGEPII